MMIERIPKATHFCTCPDYSPLEEMKDSIPIERRKVVQILDTKTVDESYGPENECDFAVQKILPDLIGRYLYWQGN